jgi:hypothetical protein
MISWIREVKHHPICPYSACRNLAVVFSQGFGAYHSPYDHTHRARTARWPPVAGSLSLRFLGHGPRSKSMIRESRNEIYRWLRRCLISVGFSFFVHGDSIEIQLIPRAVRYELPKDRDEQGRFAAKTWRRVPLGQSEDEARTLQAPASGIVHRWREPAFDSRAELYC